MERRCAPDFLGRFRCRCPALRISAKISKIHSASMGFASTRRVTLPSSVNFTALPIRLRRIWRKLGGIRASKAGNAGRRTHEQFETLRTSPCLHHLHGITHEGAYVEGRVFQSDPAGLDFGHVQHLIDEIKQVLAAAVDDIQVFAMIFGEAWISAHQSPGRLGLRDPSRLCLKSAAEPQATRRSSHAGYYLHT